MRFFESGHKRRSGGSKVVSIRVTFLTSFLLSPYSLPSHSQSPAIIDLNQIIGGPDERLVQIYGDDAGDMLGSQEGYGAALGDLDGDGFDDLILGSWLAAPPGMTETGEAYVIWGGKHLRGEIFDLAAASGAYGETRIYGEDNTDRLGFAIAAGDINGDEIDDLILGAYSSTPPGGLYAGEIIVLYGGPAFRSATQVSLDAPIGSLGETRIFGDDPLDILGWSVASGDVNSDGYDDIVTGGYTGTPAGRSRAGKVFVIYGHPNKPGTPTGTGSVLDLNTNGAISAYNETRVLGDEIESALGESVACGDVNGDGYDDVVMGAPGTLSAPPPDPTVVVYGSSTLPGTIIDLSLPAGTHGETRIQSANNSDFLGEAVSTADVDCDGVDDVIVGAIHSDPPGRPNAGEVFVVYGSDTLPNSTIELVQVPGVVDGTRFQGRAATDRLGASVSGCDFNGDGKSDLLLGAETADTPGADGVGVAYTIRSDPGIRGSTFDLSVFVPDIEILGDNSSEQFGSCTEAGGDLNADGFEDFIVGSPFWDRPDIAGDNTAGLVVALFGEGERQTAVCREAFKTGVSPERGFGGRLSPVLRAWLSFDGGHNGLGGPSVAEATLTRTNSPISGLGDGDTTWTAKALWEINLAREGHTSAEIRFQYLESEIAGLNESTLELHQASSPAGPWTEINPQQLDTARNTLMANIVSSGFFAILGNIAQPTAQHANWELYD
ncbi:MAG: hypothetical protein GHCLOJNM_03536 [bacterium]|nr:hypothetical protein [bacterium]